MAGEASYKPIKVRLWDRQLRNFDGWSWHRDQNGEPLSWEPPWLYLYGPPGSGKSEYARWWVGQWEGWEFVNVNLFIDTLRAASGNYQGIRGHIEKLSTSPRIVIDDLGNEPRDFFNHFGTRYTPAEVIETAMFRRHESGLRTLFTTNLSPYPRPGKNRSSFEALYGPKMHSRLMEFAKIYNLRGDMRKKGTTIEDVEVELRHTPEARSAVSLVPEVEDMYRLYQHEKAMTEREWQRAIKNAVPKLKPYMMKWHGLWKKERDKNRGR